jgi:membrane protein
LRERSRIILVPLLILILMALSHVIPEDRLLLTLSEYLEFVVPGQSTALVEEVRTFLVHKQVVGSILFLTMLFFSALAFTILENAMSVIFYHRVKIKRRHFLVSAVMPYPFILFLGIGLLIVTVLSGILQFVGTRSIMILGQPRSLDQLSIFLLYIVGVSGEMLLLTAIYFVMPVGRLSVRHALIGGVTATFLWEVMRHIFAWYYTTMSQIQLVYGSLTTAIAVLLSVEIGALVLLVGAQVIAEYERVSREPIEAAGRSLKLESTVERKA